MLDPPFPARVVAFVRWIQDPNPVSEVLSLVSRPCHVPTRSCVNAASSGSASAAAGTRTAATKQVRDIRPNLLNSIVMLTFPNTLGVIFGAEITSLLALGTNGNTGIPACPVERASLPARETCRLGSLHDLSGLKPELRLYAAVNRAANSY